MRQQTAGMFILCLLAPALCFADATPCEVAVSTPVVDLASARNRVFQNPTSPFAVVVFPEDALGNHIGILFYQNMGDPKRGAWSLDDRFWQDQKWASDVTSFAWADGGATLYVGTSEVYGTGCVYRLSLTQRKAECIYPSSAEISKYRSESKGFTTVVLAVDEEKRLLKVRLTRENGTNESIVSVTLP